MNEKAELKKLKKAYSDSFKPIIEISKMKIDNKALDNFEIVLGKISAGQTIANRIKELRKQSTEIIRELKKVRGENFQSAITAFINKSRKEMKYVKETEKGWRVNHFEYIMKKETSKLCVQYNRQTMITWTSICSADDISKLESKANTLLKKYEIEFNHLVTAFSDGFKEADRRKKQTSLSVDSPVDIREFIIEFRMVLMRGQLFTKNVGKILKYADLPEWAILYNVDRYREKITKVPEGQRYVFSVPSQKAQSEGKAILLGGLDFKRGYEYFSGIRAHR